MSTKDLLSQAVVIAGQEVTPQVGSLQEMTEEIEGIEPRLRTEEEEGLLRVARATKKNLPLINIAKAIQVGGANPERMPRLAVAPYLGSLERRRVQAYVDEDGRVEFTCEISVDLYNHWQLNLPPQTLPRLEGLARVGNQIGIGPALFREHVIPLVPPPLRRRQEEGVVLLFEATNWQKPIAYAGDPYLLKHIAGFVYAVLGTWDLSEREVKAYRTAGDLGIM